MSAGMDLQEALAEYISLDGAIHFFRYLGYPVQDPPVSWDVGDFPAGVQGLIQNFWLLA